MTIRALFDHRSKVAGLISVFMLVALCETSSFAQQSIKSSVGDLGATASDEPSPRSEAAVLEALDDAIAKLKAGDVAGFIEFYFPVDELRRVRSHQNSELVAISQTPVKLELLLKRLEVARQQKPQLNAGAFFATFTLPENVPQHLEIVTRKSEPPDTSPLAGYTGNLLEALAQAVRDLEAGRVEEFADRFLPVGELRHSEGKQRRAALKLRLGQHPAMVETMLRDLKTMIASAQTTDVGGSLAEVRMPGLQIDLPRAGKKQFPDRVVRFEQVGKSWRFADTTTAQQATLKKVSAQAPPSLADYGILDQITMERFGDRWRFLKF